MGFQRIRGLGSRLRPLRLPSEADFFVQPFVSDDIVVFVLLSYGDNEKKYLKPEIF